MKTGTLISLAVLIILIVIVYRYYSKIKTSGTTDGQQAQNVFSGITNTFLPQPTLTAVIPTTSTGTTTTGNVTSPIYKLGDNMYAKGIVNVYFTPDASKGQSNVAYYFNNGDKIGTYLSQTGDYILVSVNTGLFSGYANYYVLASDVYTK